MGLCTRFCFCVLCRTKAVQAITPSQVYVNGEFVESGKASVSVFDRGFLFGDSVYEVVSVLNGGIFDDDLHLRRLENSLRMLDMSMPMPKQELTRTILDLVRRNNLTEGVVYLQVTRGAADRNFNFDLLAPNGVTQNVVMFCHAMPLIDAKAGQEGVHVKTFPDERWQGCHIKTTQLLAASLAKTRAARASCGVAWFVHPTTGMVTEGESNNVFIVKGNTVMSPSLLTNILPGITRHIVRDLVEAQDGLTFVEESFDVATAQAADEAFVTSAGAFVTPVVSIDGQLVNTGSVGPIARKLRQAYIDHALGSLTFAA